MEEPVIVEPVDIGQQRTWQTKNKISGQKKSQGNHPEQKSQKCMTEMTVYIFAPDNSTEKPVEQADTQPGINEGGYIKCHNSHLLQKE